MKLNVETSELERITVEHDGAIFYIRPLTVDELSFLSSTYTKKGKIPEEAQTKYAVEILERALTGWKGLQDAKGNEIPFRREYVRPVITVLMREDELMQRLMEAALKLVTVIEEEGKKID